MFLSIAILLPLSHQKFVVRAHTCIFSVVYRDLLVPHQLLIGCNIECLEYDDLVYFCWIISSGARESRKNTQRCIAKKIPTYYG